MRQIYCFLAMVILTVGSLVPLPAISGETTQKRVAILDFRIEEKVITHKDARDLEDMVRVALKSALSSSPYVVIPLPELDAVLHNKLPAAGCKMWECDRDRIAKAGKLAGADLVVIGTIGRGGNVHRTAFEPSMPNKGLNISLELYKTQTETLVYTSIIGARNLVELKKSVKDSVTADGLNILNKQ